MCAWTNLLLAFKRAAAGKRRQPSVAAFEHRLEDNLLTLREELAQGDYAPGAYSSFYIHEPKRRLISAAPFRDRVVHHALCNVIEPVFERGFIRDSYANRRGAGTHRALARASAHARRFRYVLQCDVSQFFPSLDHEVLRRALARRLDDARVMSLVDAILASGAEVHGGSPALAPFPGDDLLSLLRPRGLPIGNLTSQFWANVYMDAFDHFVMRELRCQGYVRYVDDFLLFGDDKAFLWGCRSRLVARLEHLRLRIHDGAHPRPVSEGIPFLGFVVFPGRRRLKARKGHYFKRRLAGLLAEHRSGRRSAADVGLRLRSWLNHASYGDTGALRKAIVRDAERIARARRPLRDPAAATTR